MEKNSTFFNFSNDILYKIDKTGLSSGLFTFSIELPFRDLLEIYSLFIDQYNFSIFWQENNNTFIALDKCKSISLDNPERFKIARKFNDQIFKNIINLDSKFKLTCFSKIFYFFSFKDNINNNHSENNVPSLEGVLPKILITCSDGKILIRMNLDINLKSSVKDSLYEFWSIMDKIISQKNFKNNYEYKKISINNFYRSFDENHQSLSKKLSKAIKLINLGLIEKVVLGTRLIFDYNSNLNIIPILKNLKVSHPNSCRYVWKRNQKNLILGASPEKLFSFSQKILKLEAIAGTGKNGQDIDDFLKSEKNLREHNFVINYLISKLKFLNINKFNKSKLTVKRFGNINHLFTLITASVNKICPFKLLEILHPSPAVCGFPKKEALQLIDMFENFDRGNYASPFGWVDVNGNADFRVALRGVNIRERKIELIAGSGLVKGSICEEEIDEIKLKLESLANQIFNINLLN